MIHNNTRQMIHNNVPIKGEVVDSDPLPALHQSNIRNAVIGQPRRPEDRIPVLEEALPTMLCVSCRGVIRGWGVVRL